MMHTVVMVTGMCQLNMNFSLKSLNLPRTPDHNVMEWPQGAPIFRGPRNGNTKCAIQKTQKGPSEPAPTSAPTWIGFSFPVSSQVDFFCLPFLSPDLSFFCNSIFSPPPTWFHFILFIFAFETFPTHLLPPTVPHRPTHLYI